MNGLDHPTPTKADVLALIAATLEGVTVTELRYVIEDGELYPQAKISVKPHLPQAEDLEPRFGIDRPRVVVHEHGTQFVVRSLAGHDTMILSYAWTPDTSTGEPGHVRFTREIGPQDEWPYDTKEWV